MSDSKHFLSPVLTGKRFDQHSVPVEILQDFTALQELMVEIAKNIYLNEHGGRKRVPKGFTDGISLNLQNVEQGSAILNFLLGTALATAPILDQDTQTYSYFEKAKNKIIEVISTAQNDGNVREILSVKHLAYFNRIGRNLKEDEAITFNPTAEKTSTLNRAIRNRIVQSLSEDASYIDNFDLVAPIAGIDQIDKQFSIFVQGQKIPAALEPTYYKIITASFSDYYSQKHVAIQGEGVYDRNHKLTKINKITALTVLDPLDVSLRIGELSELEDGWFNTEGRAPNVAALSKFDELFKAYYSDMLPLPTIFPTIHGNIQLEWSIKNYEISLEVILENFKSEFISVDTDTAETTSTILELLQPNSWATLKAYLTSYTQN